MGLALGGPWPWPEPYMDLNIDTGRTGPRPALLRGAAWKLHFNKLHFNQLHFNQLHFNAKVPGERKGRRAL